MLKINLKIPNIKTKFCTEDLNKESFFLLCDFISYRMFVILYPTLFSVFFCIVCCIFISVQLIKVYQFIFTVYAAREIKYTFSNQVNWFHSTDLTPASSNVLSILVSVTRNVGIIYEVVYPKWWIGSKPS